MNISKYFTLDEMTRSDYAIRNEVDNTPSAEVVMNLTSLCRSNLDVVREIVKRPVHVLSGYRSVEVNKGIGGASNSQHVDGKASDIIVSGMSVDELFDIVSKFTDYDQVIHEFGRWVHVSYNGDKNRKEKLWAVKKEGKTVYLHEKPSI